MHFSDAGLVGGEPPAGGSAIWDSQVVGSGEIFKGQLSGGGGATYQELLLFSCWVTSDSLQSHEL